MHTSVVVRKTTVIGIIGDEREYDFTSLSALPYVERVVPILKPFKYIRRDVCPQGVVRRLSIHYAARVQGNRGCLQEVAWIMILRFGTRTRQNRELRWSET